MDGLPAIDSALLPADVRAASPADRQRYTAALQFEQLLLQRMLAGSGAFGGSGSGSDDDSGSDDGGDDTSPAGDATSAHYAQMLPGLLAESVTQAGGLGLARSIYDGMRERQ